MANFIIEDLKRLFARGGHMISRLLVINIIAFVFFNLLALYDPTTMEGTLRKYVGLPANLLDALLFFWTHITYMFTHLSFGHILWNMIYLYFFGRILEDFVGSRTVLAVYLLSGLVGGWAYILVENLGVLAGIPYFSAQATLIGASGAVTGIMAAAATLTPEYTLRLFIIGNVRLKYLVLVLIVISSLLDLWSNTGGKIAHLGGAFMGYYFIRQRQLGNDLGRYPLYVVDLLAALLKPKSNMRVAHRKKSAAKSRKGAAKSNKKNVPVQDNGNDRQRKIDAILDKISKSGYDSLTKAEKEFLFKVSKESD
ncbi:MAG: rhomboid family intramembrane serine protease [Salibacteraceae bacterium]